jgi:hypothetical protein
MVWRVSFFRSSASELDDLGVLHGGIFEIPRVHITGPISPLIPEEKYQKLFMKPSKN